MKWKWINIVVLTGLAFYVSGGMQYIHLYNDHLSSHPFHAVKESSSSNPAPETPDSHSECSVCQDMAMVRAISLEPPTVEEKLQVTGETVPYKNSVSLFSASYIIPFPRPPPFFSL